MLPIYFFCFIIGGIFVALAALAGLDGVDFDHDFETDIELSEQNHRGEEVEEIEAKKRRRDWLTLCLPFLKIKFWTFGSCFFGLTGIVLSMVQPTMSQPAIASISIAVGAVCGTSIVWALRHLRRHQANSLVRPSDLIGLTGIVEIPFDHMSQGKVQVNVKGSILNFVAFTDDPKSFIKGDRVFVVGMKNHKVWVVNEDSPNNYLDD